MGMLDRMTVILKANLNDLLDRAEDPEKMVRQLLLEMNAHLIQVRTHVAVAIADERKLRARWLENQSKADSWRTRAEAAVAAGDDELAKQALSRRNTYFQLAEGFSTQFQQQSDQVAELRDALSQLEAKVHEAEAKRDLLITRSRRAKADVSVRSVLTNTGESSLLAEFQRMEQRLDDEEQVAQAYREMDRDTVEARFQQIEEAESLDRQLADLKRQLLPAASGAETGAKEG